MRVEDLLISDFNRDHHTIRTECSQFIQESGGFPVFRALPYNGLDFRKVRVRHHKRSDVSEAFHTAFNSNIVPRGVFTQSVIMERTVEFAPFYVFPINGYKYIYSKGVQNSNVNFRDVMETLTRNINDAFEITTDLIKYTYTKSNLIEGITSDSEVIFYGISHFYAVRVGSVDSYHKLINR